MFVVQQVWIPLSPGCRRCCIVVRVLKILRDNMVSLLPMLLLLAAHVEDREFVGRAWPSADRYIIRDSTW